LPKFGHLHLLHVAARLIFARRTFGAAASSGSSVARKRGGDEIRQNPLDGLHRGQRKGSSRTLHKFGKSAFGGCNSGVSCGAGSNATDGHFRVAMKWPTSSNDFAILFNSRQESGRPNGLPEDPEIAANRYSGPITALKRALRIAALTDSGDNDMQVHPMHPAK